MDLRDRVRGEVAALARRLRRVERREVAEFRRWVENTNNLLHLTVLVVVPLLIGVVTYLSNAVDAVSFLLFPPLASGAYTLFADPEGRHSSPRRFVGGLTLGAACGVVALEASALAFGSVAPGGNVHAASAALAVLLTALGTWALDLELPTAFSTALLVLATGVSRLEYVVGVMLSALVVAGAFVAWREEFYEERARYLYGAVQGDDHVLVPVRGGHVRATVALGARLAAAHEAGKVVLLDVVGDERAAAAERDRLADGETPRRIEEPPDGDRSAGEQSAGEQSAGEQSAGEQSAGERASTDAAGSATDRGDDDSDRTAVEGAAPRGTDPDAWDPDEGGTPGAIRPDGPSADGEAEGVPRNVGAAAERLEREADRVRREFDVPCEVVVAAGDPVATVRATAEAAGCDLVVTSFETSEGAVTPFVRGVLGGGLDAVALRSTAGAESWSRILVMVARPGDAAHAMIDFAARLAGDGGRVSICTCIDGESERRRAEGTLANLAETADRSVETRVSRSSVEAFVDANADVYDLVLFGASRGRSRASRFVAPPLFERLDEFDPDCDAAVVGRS